MSKRIGSTVRPEHTVFLRAPRFGSRVTSLIGILLSASALALEVGDLESQTQRPLNLRETSAHSVADSFPVSGITALSAGRFGMWSSLRPYVLVGVQGSFDEVGAGILHRPVSMGSAPNTSVVEVVDAAQNAVVSFDGGRLLGVARMGLPIAIDAAARADSGWYVGGTSASGMYRVFFVLSELKYTTVFEEAADSQNYYHLTSAGNSVVITRRTSPFESIVVSPNGEVAVRFAPPDIVPAVDGSGVAMGRWSSISVVAAPEFFLHGLTDPTSDLRRLIVFGTDGKVLRSHVSSLPMMFWAENDGELVAFRRIVSQQIITYAWSWGAESH